MSTHSVRVGPLPAWMPVDRLLGPAFVRVGDHAQAQLPRDEAADVLARLRGLGFGGHRVDVQVRPRLKRTAIRDGRTRDARARRDTTPGFTRSGTRYDDEGRYSLTPDALALWIGERARTAVGSGARVVDAGCGAGGNAIGFARAGLAVTAVEQHQGRLQDAVHNATIYGVADAIHFIHGDAAQHLAGADLVFVDPPWGTDYARDRVDRLDTLDALLPLVPPGTPVWCKLPPSFVPWEGAEVTAVFGRAKGDRHRVKFLLLCSVAPTPHADHHQEREEQR